MYNTLFVIFCIKCYISYLSCLTLFCIMLKIWMKWYIKIHVILHIYIYIYVNNIGICWDAVRVRSLAPLISHQDDDASSFLLCGFISEALWMHSALQQKLNMDSPPVLTKRNVKPISSSLELTLCQSNSKTKSWLDCPPKTIEERPPVQKYSLATRWLKRSSLSSSLLFIFAGFGPRLPPREHKRKSRKAVSSWRAPLILQRSA